MDVRAECMRQDRGRAAVSAGAGAAVVRRPKSYAMDDPEFDLDGNDNGVAVSSVVGRVKPEEAAPTEQSFIAPEEGEAEKSAKPKQMKRKAEKLAPDVQPQSATDVQIPKVSWTRPCPMSKYRRLAGLVADVQIPKATVKRIMKMDKDVSKVGAETIFLVAKAAEFFLERFALEAHKNAIAKGRKGVQYRDLAAVAPKAASWNQDWSFLDGVVPPLELAEGSVE